MCGGGEGGHHSAVSTQPLAMLGGVVLNSPTSMPGHVQCRASPAMSKTPRGDYGTPLQFVPWAADTLAPP